MIENNRLNTTVLLFLPNKQNNSNMPTLHWIGKEKVINHHRDVPFKVLEHKQSLLKY